MAFRLKKPFQGKQTQIPGGLLLTDAFVSSKRFAAVYEMRKEQLKAFVERVPAKKKKAE